jgi:hypothetical protein
VIQAVDRFRRNRERGTRAILPAVSAALLSALLAALLAAPASAQTDLGGQRVATSSGTFLKIGLDARGAALGGAYTPLVEGPAAVLVNPAGILFGPASPAVQFGLVQWPADLQIGLATFSMPIPSLGVHVGAGVAWLGATMDETTEFYPAGTGRTVGYSDLLLAGTLARSFTDKLGIGMSVKYLREDLGANVGGTTTQSFLLDAGSVYQIGWRNSRLSVTLSDFGSDLNPGTKFESNVNQSMVAYTAFSPPTRFQLGLCVDPWNRGPHRLTASTVILHQADNAETLRGGLEYRFRENYALRTGYDFSADEMGFSAGLGLAMRLGERQGTFDYTFTDGGHLGTVHRFSLGFAL